MSGVQCLCAGHVFSRQRSWNKDTSSVDTLFRHLSAERNCCQTLETSSHKNFWWGDHTNPSRAPNNSVRPGGKSQRKGEFCPAEMGRQNLFQRTSKRRSNLFLPPPILLQSVRAKTQAHALSWPLYRSGSHGGSCQFALHKICLYFPLMCWARNTRFSTKTCWEIDSKSLLLDLRTYRLNSAQCVCLHLWGGGEEDVQAELSSSATSGHLFLGGRGVILLFCSEEREWLQFITEVNRQLDQADPSKSAAKQKFARHFTANFRPLVAIFLACLVQIRLGMVNVLNTFQPDYIPNIQIEPTRPTSQKYTSRYVIIDVIMSDNENKVDSVAIFKQDTGIEHHKTWTAIHTTEAPLSGGAIWLATRHKSFTFSKFNLEIPGRRYSQVQLYFEHGNDPTRQNWSLIRLTIDTVLSRV